MEFELRDSKGKVLEKLVTDAAGHAESGLYEIATYKNGEFGKSIKYYLVETKTLDSTKHEIVFEYVDQNTPVIEVTKDLTNKGKQPEGNEAQPHDSGTTGRTSSKTGDNTNLWLPIALMIGAASLDGGILCGSKKKKKQNKQDKKSD